MPLNPFRWVLLFFTRPLRWSDAVALWHKIRSAPVGVKPDPAIRARERHLERRSFQDTRVMDSSPDSINEPEK